MIDTIDNKKSSWLGNVELVYTRQRGETKIASVYAQAPFKIQRPFYPEGKQICHSVIFHTAGGIVGGDRLCQNIKLQPKTQVLITTPAANRVYRSNGQQAEQDIEIVVDDGACLEYLPQETIVFKGANFRQNLRVELTTEKSTWLGWEIIRFGRSARGEIFDQGEWRSYTEVWRQGKPLWIDRQWLPGNEELFYSLNGLAGKPVVGTLSWIGKPVTPSLIQEVINQWQPQKDNSEIGVTQLLQGVLCRYRGDSITEVKNWFIQVWQLLRQIEGKPYNKKPRVWLI